MTDMKNESLLNIKSLFFLAEVINVFLSPWITPALHLLPRFFVRNEGKVRSFEMKQRNEDR